MKTLLTLLFATVLMGALAVTNVQPAQADQAAVRRNTLIGAAALFAGIAIETNVAHKRRLANTVQGYLPNVRWMRPHAASCCASRVLPGDSTLRGSVGSANAAPLPAGDNVALFSILIAALTSACSA